MKASDLIKLYESMETSARKVIETMYDEARPGGAPILKVDAGTRGLVGQLRTRLNAIGAETEKPDL